MESWRHVGVEGLLSVFLWGYNLTSIKPSDDTSRATHQSVYVFTSRLNLINFHNKNEFFVFRRSSRQTNPSGNRMLLYSKRFSSGFISQFRRLITYSNRLVEAPQQLTIFSLVISTKNLSDETAHPKPNPFLSGHNNKRRPTHIVNLLFYNETRYPINKGYRH